MKLYYLVRLTESEYDIAWGFVVRAKSPKAARRLAAGRDTGNVGWQGNVEINRWLVPKFSSCSEVKAEGKEEIIVEERTSA